MFKKIVSAFKKLSEKDLNPVMASVASFLIDDRGVDVETPFKEYLNKNKLDYSLESLKKIDDYLEKVRNEDKKNKLSAKEWERLIFRCGAYLGEVIRKKREAKFDCRWTDYKNATRLVRQMKILFPKDTIFTRAVLVDQIAGRPGIYIPMGEVDKFLQKGRKASLFLYAKNNV